MRFTLLFAVMFFGLVCWMPKVSGAQESAAALPAAPASDDSAKPKPEDSAADVQKLQAGAMNVSQAKIPLFSDEKYGSLVFTYWEQQAIKEAKASRGLVRAPSADELMRDLKNDDLRVERKKPPPEEREIRLGGIVFKGGKNWTIWLNEKRVTPSALPLEVLDLKVTKGYVEMKWFDEWSNQIFPIRLRPHQRFNIDARMFLPG